jgi:hypothetical protein
MLEFRTAQRPAALNVLHCVLLDLEPGHVIIVHRRRQFVVTGVKP